MKWLMRSHNGNFLSFKNRVQPLLSILKVYSKTYSSFLGKWELPEGYETGINIYNSSINKKVPLVLKNKDVATWYVCGPTVYEDSHIGHASCYVKFDIIRRIMENAFGINVILLMGITDIDDKIIKKSSEVGLSVFEVSKKYELEFFKDMESMRVKSPSAVSCVTDNVPCIIAFCKKLIEKDYAYVTDEGNVYFMASKGIASDLTNELPDDAQSIIDPLKRDKRDFALWKAAKENEPFWVSPWGNGRPGWHIECSAMASKMFGSHLDIHSGGYDLLFPHHSNEKSQSEAYHNCGQWGNYWIHSGLLQVGDGIKMSKSIKNTLSIKDFLEENSVNDFRMLCLQSPYRKNMSYSEETLEGAKGLHRKFHNFISDSAAYIAAELDLPSIDGEKLLRKLKSTKEEITSLFADNFNTSQALFCLTDLIDEINEDLQKSTSTPDSGTSGLVAMAACSDYIENFLHTLGIDIICKKRLKREFVHFMDAVHQFRIQIRLYAKCQIDTVENQTASEFIEDLYEHFNSRKSLVNKEEDLYQVVAYIEEAVNLTYKKAAKFALTIHQTSGDQKAAKKKKRTQFLFLCDELRASLQKHGIVIKDMKDISTWYPLPTFPV